MWKRCDEERIIGSLFEKPGDKELKQKLMEVIDPRDVASELSKRLSQIVETFELPVAYPTNEEVVEKLEEYITVMFGRPFSDEHVQLSLKIGKVHLDEGVSPVVFMEGFEELRQIVAGKVLNTSYSEREKCEITGFVNRVVSFSVVLVSKSYFDEATKELEVHIEKLERLNKIYEILRDINLLLFQDYPSDFHFFQDVCKIFSSVGKFPLVWVGLLDEDKDTVIPVAYSVYGIKEEVAERLISEFNVSISRYRKEGFEKQLQDLFSGKAVFIEDIITGLPDTPRKKVLLELGCKSAIVLPIFSDEEVKGGMFVYGTHEHVFTKDELDFLREISRDISLGWLHMNKRRELEATLFSDSLTGLGNIKYFFEALEHEMEIARKRGLKLAVLRIDIDGLSVINHNFGYSVGDEILKTLAKRLVDTVGLYGTVARTGADDFSVSYLVESYAAMRDFLFKLKESLHKPITIDGETVRITTSIGIAFYPDDAEDKSTLFDRASFALKRAQSAGANSVVFYSEEGTVEIVKKYRLLDELERAFERKEFVLFYQPRISIRTREISGFEALLRWRHPERGIVLPGEFISVLEESGLIVDVGFWVVEESARFLRRISSLIPEAIVSFNVSVNQFMSENFVLKIADILEKEGVFPVQMEMEITERIMFKAADNLNAVLSDLKELRINIAIDDFGTGYSSMIYLKKIPSRCLKIDYTFVSGIPDDRENVEVVMAISNLARSFSKKTVAEGVETREQLVFLTGLGVDEAQGFYFAKPMPELEVFDFIRDYSKERFFWSSN